MGIYIYPSNSQITYLSIKNQSLIKKSGFRRKRVKKHYLERNTTRTIEIRKDKTLEYIELIMRGYKFIYIDESGFNDHVA